MLAEAKACALRLLARREHSQAELRTKLSGRNFDAETVAQALQACAEQGLQSDARFTEAYVNMRINHGYGPLRIYGELHQRGIGAELIRRYLDMPEEFWQEKLAELRQKKYKGERAIDYSARAKQMRFFQQRGFSVEQIKALY